ncbi:MAG: ATPase [Acidobacteria bacterium 13_1_40CM_65_14]|nr:MAG: ATPase [Acidobacteria bacterium 13_1_40CM_65_14]OLC83690.1 MAG: ATPase [Acidobacteria bacterium 13_1_40CM_4_65_8]OLE85321.1 MAG: ATPase [Acidobacteria bacterium 13_1_20CM_2_65_9]
MTTPADDAVAVDRVSKNFGSTVALADVSFSVQRAERFGFIGPDGAGKTTLFRILATLMAPDQGRARVLGRDVVSDLWTLRARIGYMPGRFSLYPDLSVDENLRFFASVFGTTIEREYQQIAPIYSQLEPFRDRRAAALSGGMKQKLALCCALVHRPEILFLDEPTTGVDAVSRREFWDLLDTFKQSGMTILVSTPYMDEANRCDRVALMQGGRILAIDTPQAIADSFDRPLFAIRASDRYRALKALREWPHTHSVYPFGETLHYADKRTDVPADRIATEMLAFLSSHGFDDASVERTAPTVEDSFIARMGAPEGVRAA